MNADDLPALPDRIGWLCRKATLWVEHAVGDVRGIVAEMVTARAAGAVDTDPVELASLADHDLAELFEEAITDPIVFDAALNEGGLFALFLRERAELLPADEQLLAASWLTTDRSVHEVVGVDPDNGLTLRDLATGEVVDVRERTGSRTMSVGERHCACVVPDGESHQMIGGVFPVRTGHEDRCRCIVGVWLAQTSTSTTNSASA